MDQHAGGKWLIHDTKRHKDNQLQSLIISIIGACMDVFYLFPPFISH